MTKQEMIAKLKAARKAQRLTLMDLGEKMGMTRSNAASLISAWERGTNAPQLDSLVKWVHALGFSLEMVPDKSVCACGVGACEAATAPAGDTP